MTTVAARPLAAAPVPGGAALRLVASAGGRSTLEDVISGVWEDLAAGRSAACPVCASPLRARRAEPAACVACGSTLS